MIKRARGVLAELEATKHAAPRSARSTRCRCSPTSRRRRRSRERDVLREALATIDPDELSPREAQAALYELKRLARESEP